MIDHLLLIPALNPRYRLLSPAQQASLCAVWRCLCQYETEGWVNLAHVVLEPLLVRYKWIPHNPRYVQGAIKCIVEFDRIDFAVAVKAALDSISLSQYVK
ncbi:uncharacterized protein PHALS_13936 [Plasmopara halstedii]|uniref:Uncharacterized protein n=1 Tax=Plasmopara halstedii TaxID=4781 RepID=A0A0P1A535_PLAHL|nr:uncharacterized protein PHALS_13936 [Plasmopara halstedii]CEG35185.1 hypothetical protein PHALS_13936 [Plasmopara halstedii]|eukprot:XP_024571554.1 hypothetical protein PHALS_13936 [Plasmopara halstedii]